MRIYVRSLFEKEERVFLQDLNRATGQQRITTMCTGAKCLLEVR
jgi:hypothetical protein